MPVRTPSTRLTALACTALAVTAAAAGAGTAQAATTAAVTTTPVVDNSTRAGALAAYRDVYLPQTKVPVGWNGSVATCTPGAPTAASQTATLTALNYYRSMVGIAPVGFDPTWNAQAQDAALMMAARGNLDHTTDPTWRCYTAGGKSAAAGGNLGMGYTSGADAISGYVDDSDSVVLGHRRQTLDARFTKMGHGQTSSTDSLKMFEGYPRQADPAGTPAFVTWPDSGYVPYQLVPVKHDWARGTTSPGPWSIQATSPDVDFASATATVTVTATGAAVPVTVTHPDPSYGMGRDMLAFTPTTGYAGGADKSFTVRVTGMKKGGVVQPAYTYTTTLFDPAYTPAPAPKKAQTLTWSTPASTRQGTRLALTATASSGRPVTYSTTTGSVCSVSGATLTALRPGYCRVTATQAGDGTWAATSTTREIGVAATPLPPRTHRVVDRAWAIANGLAR